MDQRFWRTVGMLAAGAVFQMVVGTVASRVFKAVINNPTILDLSIVITWLTLIIVGGLVVMRFANRPPTLYGLEPTVSKRSLKKRLKSINSETLVGGVLPPNPEYGSYVDTYQIRELRFGEIALLRRLAIRPGYHLPTAQCEQILDASGMKKPSLVLASLRSSGYLKDFSPSPSEQLTQATSAGVRAAEDFDVCLTHDPVLVEAYSVIRHQVDSAVRIDDKPLVRDGGLVGC